MEILNLADLIVNAKDKMGEGRSEPYGRNCQLCGFMEETTDFTDKCGMKMKFISEIDYRTTKGVRGMRCRGCEKRVNVGKTMNRVIDGFTIHLADLRRRMKEIRLFISREREGHEEGDR